MDAEVESVMASSQDQREEELQVHVIITWLSKFRNPINQSDLSIAGPIFFKYWTGRGPE